VHGEPEELVVTLLVIRDFSDLPGASMDFVDFRDPTDFSRFMLTHNPIRPTKPIDTKKRGQASLFLNQKRIYFLKRLKFIKRLKI